MLIKQEYYYYGGMGIVVFFLIIQIIPFLRNMVYKKKIHE
jgi:hypothetical protein